MRLDEYFALHGDFDDLAGVLQSLAPAQPGIWRRVLEHTGAAINKPNAQHIVARVRGEMHEIRRDWQTWDSPAGEDAMFNYRIDRISTDTSSHSDWIHLSTYKIHTLPDFLLPTEEEYDQDDHWKLRWRLSPTGNDLSFLYYSASLR